MEWEKTCGIWEVCGICGDIWDCGVCVGKESCLDRQCTDLWNEEGIQDRRAMWIRKRYVLPEVHGTEAGRMWIWADM